MKLGSPKRQIFGNLEVRMSILIGNERDFNKRMEQKVSEIKVKIVSHFFNTVACFFCFFFLLFFFFDSVGMLKLTEETV